MAMESSRHAEVTHFSGHLGISQVISAYMILKSEVANLGKVTSSRPLLKKKYIKNPKACSRQMSLIKYAHLWSIVHTTCWQWEGQVDVFLTLFRPYNIIIKQLDHERFIFLLSLGPTQYAV